MAVPLSPDSRTSLVSIDPQIAQQISRSTSSHRRLSFDAKRVLADPAPEQQKYQPNGAARNQQLEGKPFPKGLQKTRKNSLRRVKNSTDVLRQRSKKAQDEAKASDGTSGNKEGHNFTVGNVGTGGKLYLRPAASRPQHRTPPAFVFHSSASPDNAAFESTEQAENIEGVRQSIWSNSQISDKPAKVKFASSATYRSKSSDGPTIPSAHVRAFSFSTVDDAHKSSSDVQDGVLRIVIDRSATARPKTAEQFVMPTLEIPIPHYRLGKPHFDAEGTPFLRSSTYTRTSEGMSENLKPSADVKNDLIPPASSEGEGRAMSKDQTSGRGSHPDGATTETFRDSADVAHSLANYNYGGSIDPEVFDKLAIVQDDASVVRYSQRTGAITAATPARIVAQISSEAFMDYELVSDFFLTFRAYLSPESLLGLLLARLRWAINRLEDDGRIIRIRTFAALRHWILNYFADDFVVNRKLRVHFCDQINDMYDEVNKRTGGGVSDLKILLDLKRCWNGRCSLYWDSADFVVDNRQEADIVPGGFLGSRDASLGQFIVHPDQESDSIPKTNEEKIDNVNSWFGRPPAAQGSKFHHKGASFPSAGAPVSPTSEQSLQPASCSIPASVFKRSAFPEGNLRGPYPVSTQSRKQDSPDYLPTSVKDSHHRLSQIHKRTASTSDSIRDRGSISSLSRPQLLANPHAGSLIRGNVYPPAAPFVDVIAPESPPSQRSRLNAQSNGVSASFESFSKQGSVANPGMRTLMGSIRRALSSKQTTITSASSTEETTRSAPSLRGKTSGLPLNIARSIDNLRDKKSMAAPRHHLRIDLLCAAVSQSYQMAQAKASQDSFANHGLGVSISDIHEDAASQHSIGSRDFSIEAGDVQHVLGHQIAQDDSTTSDDATGLDLQVNKKRPRRDSQGELPGTKIDFGDAAMVSMPLLLTERSARRTSLNSIDRRRSSSVDTALTRKAQERDKSRDTKSRAFSKDVRFSSRKSRRSGQTRELRAFDTTSVTHGNKTVNQRKASCHGPPPSLDGTVTSTSTTEAGGNVKPHGPAQTLRRRPGGNLRNIENVHDLGPVLRRQSTGSLTTRSESVGSMLVIGSNRATRNKQKKPTSRTLQHHVSMLRTHSSQHLRPSFEAAISGFSAIPDDGDGGLEATLLKLEGRYEKMSTEMAHRTRVQSTRVKTALHEHSIREEPQTQANGQDPRSKSSRSPVSSRRSNGRLKEPASVLKIRKPSTKNASTRSGRSKDSVADSEESYSSIPFLERGLPLSATKKPKPFPTLTAQDTIPPPLFERQADFGVEQDSASSHTSIELVEKTESMGRIPQGSTFPDPRPHTAADSFLLDEDDNLTDLSSELSVDAIDNSEATPRILPSMVDESGTALPARETRSHPLAHPPSPAFSFHHAVTSVPPLNPTMYQQKPLTPQPSPTQGNEHRSSHVQVSQILPPRKSAPIASATVTTSAGHIPFILACESETLAQQLTLVEKGALSEIDWSDLVDMKWDNKSPNILNWVEYLAAKDNKGIDIVITRFNIVVKWVLSEIVMTQNLHERAQVLIKYVHIAAHTRQMHNYATMLQITIALTSIDCSKLKATWELVPDLEKALLKEMEELIQPVRNFHDLRIEMETADLQDGCIPFVGLYVHDLTYNAQKPAQLASTGDGEPLVNFERYRTTATIVKSLLRLIDASSKYTFAPIPGIIERCLWIAALSDEKITALSKSIES